MKIDFLDNTHIKINLSKKELENHNIKIHSFLSNPKNAANYINEILKNSNTLLHKKQSFEFIVTSIISLNYNTFIFFISVKSNLSVNKNDKSSIISCSFTQYDEFVDTFTYLTTFKEKYDFKITKFKLHNKYILTISLKNNTQLKKFQPILDEFINSNTISKLNYALLQEEAFKL